MPPDAPFEPTQAASVVPERGGPERPVLGARYELIALLGAGGMGNVYKAHDRELDEMIALKVLRPEIAGAPGALERFRREVKLARRVTHPNVARVFDIGEHDGAKILTMELVDGEPLSALLRRSGALPIARAIELVGAVCAGVAAAHAAGVVHRDLKPDNVLLAHDGRVVVSDFGIARAAVAPEASRTMGFVGTPAYMAPEQVEGTEIDERADVYALGVMLYEMVTGALPWQGESALAVAAARLLHAPPDPRVLRPDTGDRLADLVLACLARRREDRPARMAQIATTLATITPTFAAAAIAATAAPRIEADSNAGDKRVAVLPFRNLGDAEHAYLAEALTDDLIDALSIARGLRVRSRGMVARYRGLDHDPRQLGRELDVQVVVEGSIRRAPGAFRISARLVSVGDGLQLWAERFDGTEAEMLELNDRVARAVADALTADLVRVKRSPDPEAVDLYLRGRLAYHRSYLSDMSEAARLLAAALERAPDDPRVLSGFVMARARTISDAATAALLRTKAERAVELAPSLPDAHAALGAALFQGLDEIPAIRSLRRALHLAPNNAEAHDVLGLILPDSPAGRRHLEKAMALEPDIVLAPMVLSRHYALSGEWDRVDALVGTAPHLLAPRARMIAWRRDTEAAAALAPAFPVIASLPPYARATMGITKAYIDITLGGRVPREALVAPPYVGWRLQGIFAQLRCELAAMQGDVEGALELLELADELRLYDLAWMEHCPLLDTLRGEPRFRAVQPRVEARVAGIVAAYAAAT